MRNENVELRFMAVGSVKRKAIIKGSFESLDSQRPAASRWRVDAVRLSFYAVRFS